MARQSDRRPDRRPTDAELEILNVIWERGPSTVREVLTTILGRRDAGYTTILKLMQIMTDKGLLERDESVRPQLYRAASSRGRTEKQMIGHLLDRVFSGASGRLALTALNSGETTAEERDEIRRLLDQIERKQSSRREDAS